MNLEFLGAAGTVTGSKYLLRSGGKSLLVDCGMFQGLKALRLKNWEQPSFPIGSIDAIVLTHAHIDHSGFLPRLHRLGYRGPVYCTPSTKRLCHILLLDSAKLMEEEAGYANRKAYSRHHPALPLFTSEDAENVLKQFIAVPFHSPRTIEGFEVEFKRAGHILGAASLRVLIDGKTISFSGDIGRLNDPVMVSPEPLAQTDVLVVESTYGNRVHPKSDPMKALENIFLEAHESGGNVLIPAFAVGRSQEILYYVGRLIAENRMPDMPVFIDSPMAMSVTSLYADFPEDHRLSIAEYEMINRGVRYVRNVEESKRTQAMYGSKVVISASGMATGGRVLHYLKKFLPEKENIILFTGYQAAGTRGANLVQGSGDIKIHGEYFPVRAKVRILEIFSAHADSSEIIEWLSSSNISPTDVFITHGEPGPADALRLKISDRFGWRCHVPTLGESVKL